MHRINMLFWRQGIKMEITVKENEYTGPFAAVFGNPTAKVLDQCLIVGTMEQTISMLADSTDLSYKTVLSVVEKLETLGYMTATRKIGNAQAYKFEVESHLSEFIKCAQKIHLERIRKEME
jgi:hypothetical protein